MEGKLVGVHKVKARTKAGEVTYYYAWRGGPRIQSKPGTRAFTQEFLRLTRGREKKATNHSVAWLAQEYQKSADFHKLKPSTRRDYERIIDAICLEFDGLNTQALEAKGARRIFVDWRDGMRQTPRSADLHLTVLARIISWAKNRELVLRNPLERVPKLHKGSRKDSIWMPSQLAAMLKDGAPHIVNVVNMALWTMQRQGDILTMPTIAYDDGRLWITQGKTGARVRIRPADEILPLCEEAKAQERTRILVNSRGENWTSSGFRASWRRELARLGIKGVRFHDLRGTAITYAYAMGMDIDRIAEISGHSKGECETIIRRNYLAGSDIIEAIRAGTKGV